MPGPCQLVWRRQLGTPEETQVGSPDSPLSAICLQEAPFVRQLGRERMRAGRSRGHKMYPGVNRELGAL